MTDLIDAPDNTSGASDHRPVSVRDQLSEIEAGLSPRDRLAISAGWEATDILSEVQVNEQTGRAVIVWHRKYGSKTGERVVIAQRGAGNDYFIKRDVFIPDELPTIKNGEVAPGRTASEITKRWVPDVLQARSFGPTVKPELPPALTPTSGLTQASFTYHVRRVADHELLASCPTIQAARQIAVALGPDTVRVLKFRDSRVGYEVGPVYLYGTH